MLCANIAVYNINPQSIIICEDIYKEKTNFDLLVRLIVLFGYKIFGRHLCKHRGPEILKDARGFLKPYI